MVAENGVAGLGIPFWGESTCWPAACHPGAGWRWKWPGCLVGWVGSPARSSVVVMALAEQEIFSKRGTNCSDDMSESGSETGCPEDMGAAEAGVAFVGGKDALIALVRFHGASRPWWEHATTPASFGRTVACEKMFSRTRILDPGSKSRHKTQTRSLEELNLLTSSAKRRSLTEVWRQFGCPVTSSSRCCHWSRSLF